MINVIIARVLPIHGENMKFCMLIAVVGILLISAGAYAEDGQTTFNSLRCGMCHKPDTGTTMPSLKDIAAAYEGNEDQLLSYLKGESESVVNPGKKGMMTGALLKTKKLEDDQRKALADFILSH